MNTGINNQCWIVERLGNLRMTPAEREAAKAYIQQGARIADFTIPALASIRSIADRVGRGFRGLTRLSH